VCGLFVLADPENGVFLNEGKSRDSQRRHRQAQRVKTREEAGSKQQRLLESDTVGSQKGAERGASRVFLIEEATTAQANQNAIVGKWDGRCTGTAADHRQGPASRRFRWKDGSRSEMAVHSAMPLRHEAAAIILPPNLRQARERDAVPYGYRVATSEPRSPTTPKDANEDPARGSGQGRSHAAGFWSQPAAFSNTAWSVRFAAVIDGHTGDSQTRMRSL